MPKMKISDLNRIITESESIDRVVFANQRSNILLIAGEHYTKKGSKDWNRLRELEDLTREQRLRITKNHIQKIFKATVNEILTLSPGVDITPNNEDEAQDRKSAELNRSVWEYGRKFYRLDEKIQEWAEDFVGIGEAAVRISWDKDKGDLLGYQQAVDPATGEPLFGEPQQMPAQFDPASGQVIPPQMVQGEPIPDETKPIFSGEFKFKRIFGFNLLRPQGSQRMDEAEWLCEVDMVRTKEVKRWVGDDAEKAKKITESSIDNFFVFDSNSHSYGYKRDYTKVYSMFYRKCAKYPNGYFYIFTKELILFEGELPYGVFPIVYSGYDSCQTSPRANSVIKVLRPYQIEVNRCASKIAEHQTTVGDDKVLLPGGSKLTQGATYSGVRAMQYSGGREPKHIPGRDGSQYMPYMEQQITEMYFVANVAEQKEEKVIQGQDAWGQLFKSAQQRKKFVLYGRKFGRFLNDICELYLTLAREYFEPGRLIPMVGRNEMVNIAEFKNTEPLLYQITIKSGVDDFTTQFGKQLAINHTLQYSGGQLDKNEYGRLIRSMPFGNFEEVFKDFTIDYDSIQNLMLALDRGETPQPSMYDDSAYVIKHLVHKIRSPEFMFLPPEIQQRYMQYKQMYEQMEVAKRNQILAEQADFIPTGGAKVKVDLYLPKPGSKTGAVERATLPQEALNWLVDRLANQGSTQDRLKTMNKGAAAEVAALRQQTPIPRQQGQAAGAR